MGNTTGNITGNAPVFGEIGSNIIRESVSCTLYHALAPVVLEKYMYPFPTFQAPQFFFLPVGGVYLSTLTAVLSEIMGLRAHWL